MVDSDYLPGTNALPMLEWCAIPAGEVTIVREDDQRQVTRTKVQIHPFYISKYPVTNAQFELFISEKQGYADPYWWTFSDEARRWRADLTHFRSSRFSDLDHPRQMVTWYEAMAFCFWLSDRTGATITLPTGAQWQRAAQGDDDRTYPWGDDFNPRLGNTRESLLKQTSSVSRYPDGRSPYDVHDMAGNVWEWCRNADGDHGENPGIHGDTPRIVYGGSFVSASDRAQTDFHYCLDPATFYATIGFRLAYLP